MTRRLACCGLALSLLVSGVAARRQGAGEAAAPAPEDPARVTIRDVRPVPEAQGALVVLETTKKDRLLLVVIGQPEALAILSQLGGAAAPPRPMTHDLLKNVIAQLGATLDRIVVTRFQDGTFYAELVLRRGDAILRVDARPSDAMALAQRAGASIFVARQVLDEAGTRPDELREREAPAPPRRPPIDPNRAI